MKDEVQIGYLQRLDLRVGTVLSARLNQGARKPAYVLEIDFGELGTRTSSAQLAADYDLSELPGSQVVVVLNLPSRQVAGVRSEVLVLASVAADGTTRLVRPDTNVPNGSSIS